VVLYFESTPLIKKPGHGSYDISGGLATRFKAVKRGTWLRDVDILPKWMCGDFTHFCAEVGNTA
jgi:hypothetical protein